MASVTNDPWKVGILSLKRTALGCVRFKGIINNYANQSAVTVRVMSLIDKCLFLHK